MAVRRGTMRRFRPGPWLYMGWLCWAPVARGQEAERSGPVLSSVDASVPSQATEATVSNASALAEELFRQARAAWEEGHFEAACAKFRESQRLEASAGTILNVARCEAREGRVASAWASYRKAAHIARASGREAIAAEGEARAAELEGRLSYITVRVSQLAEGEVIRLGRYEIGAAAFGTRLPVDPGRHLVTARSKGRVEWRQQLELGESESLVVQIPTLAPLSPAPDSATNPWPWVLGGGGVVLLAGGLATALLAKGAYDSAEDSCPSHTDCGPGSINKSNEANTLANMTNVLVPLGALALGGGITWLVFQSKTEHVEPQPPSLALLPLGDGGAMARVGGRF